LATIPFTVGAGVAAKGLSLGARAARGAAIGAGTGALYGVGSARELEDIPESVLSGATLGGLLGGALPVAGAGMKKALTSAKKFVSSGRKMIEGFPIIGPSLKRTNADIADDLAGLTQGTGDISAVGGAAREGFDDAAAQVKGTIGKVYARAEKRVPKGTRINTTGTEKVLHELEDETTREGMKRLQGIRENLRFPKPVESVDEAIDYLRKATPKQIEAIGKPNIAKIAKAVLDKEVERGTIPTYRADIEHFVQGGRGKYISSLYDTLSYANIRSSQAVKGELKEYFVKKYGNELGETIYDIAIKKNGVLDTKFVSGGGTDKFERWFNNTIAGDQKKSPIAGSSGGSFPMGNTANSTTPSVLNKTMPQFSVNVNPNYQQARSLASSVSELSKSGAGDLTGAQYGRINSAIRSDIDASVGSKAAAALRNADKLYRMQRSDPNSISSALRRLLGGNNGVSDAALGSRVVRAATGKGGDIKGLAKVLNRAPNADAIKEEIQSTITTQAKFNAMSEAQHNLVYGDKLSLADRIFNGGILNRGEKAVNKALDALGNGAEKLGNNTRPYLIQLLLGDK
jgi:hypothetical protein